MILKLVWRMQQRPDELATGACLHLVMLMNSIGMMRNREHLALLSPLVSISLEAEVPAKNRERVLTVKGKRPDTHHVISIKSKVITISAPRRQQSALVSRRINSQRGDVPDLSEYFVDRRSNISCAVAKSLITRKDCPKLRK